MTLTKYIRAGAVTLGALTVIGTANAADIYSGGGSMKDVPIVVAPPIWSGFYAGVHLGAAWANLDVNRNTFYDERYAQLGALRPERGLPGNGHSAKSAGIT